MTSNFEKLIFFCLVVVSFPARATLFEGTMCKMKTGAPGICTTVAECSTIDDSLKKKVMSFGDLVHCSYRDKEHIICCPDVQLFPPDFTSTTEDSLIFRKNATIQDEKNTFSTVEPSESDKMWKSYIDSAKNANKRNLTEEHASTTTPSSDDLWNSYLVSLKTTTMQQTATTTTTTTSRTIVVGEVVLDKDSEFFDLSQMLSGRDMKNEQLIAASTSFGKDPPPSGFDYSQLPRTAENSHNNYPPQNSVGSWPSTQQLPILKNPRQTDFISSGLSPTHTITPDSGNPWYNQGNLGNNGRQQSDSQFHNGPFRNGWQNIPQKPGIFPPQNGVFPSKINHQQRLRHLGPHQPSGGWQHPPPAHNSAKWQVVNGKHNSPRPMNTPYQMGQQIQFPQQPIRGQFRHGGGGSFSHGNPNQFDPFQRNVDSRLREHPHSLMQPSPVTDVEDPMAPFKFQLRAQPASSDNLSSQRSSASFKADESSERDGPRPSSSSNEKLLRTDIDRPAVVACKRLQEKLKNELTQKILDGIPAELGEFPHMAAIGFPQIGNDLNYTFDCGGSLISDKFVLTAAHCLLESRRQPTIIRLGKVAIHSDREIDNVGAVDVGIKQIIAHDLYSTSETYHDIGLIELEHSVKFNSYIRPTCVHTELGDLDSNATLYVTGWGTVDRDTRRVSGILLKAPLQISPLDKCNASQVYYGLNRRLARGVIPDQLCAYDPKARKDACQGDSGGPLQLVIDQNLYSYSVVGIVSSGFGCGTTTPGLYTRVAAYLDFIEKYVWPTGG